MLGRFGTLVTVGFGLGLVACCPTEAQPECPDTRCVNGCCAFGDGGAEVADGPQADAQLCDAGVTDGNPG
jgi:hypothetical protein